MNYCPTRIQSTRTTLPFTSCYDWIITMLVNYHPWGYNPAKTYWYKPCYYQFTAPEPYYHFYIIYYKYDTYYCNYLYCYYPIFDYYWCKCYSPVNPLYDPATSYWSVLDPAHRFNDVSLCEPYFPTFVTSPANFPPTFTTPMSSLPGDLP
jgi:hypothetical protein